MELLDKQSIYYDGPIEGLVLRKVGSQKSGKPGRDNFFADRAKLVRPDFLQNIEEQWTRQKFVKNILSTYY